MLEEFLKSITLINPMKKKFPAADRNKGPILEALKELLPLEGSLLEIASGTGQHIVHFASHFTKIDWQPSDMDPDHILSIQSHIGELGLKNVRKPVQLDILKQPWYMGQFDVIYNANLIHISSWETCQSLMKNASKHLKKNGLLLIYGPFFFENSTPEPSNIEFDQSLKKRDPKWGIRNFEEIELEAKLYELQFLKKISMPAKNHLLVFKA